MNNLTNTAIILVCLFCMALLLPRSASAQPLIAAKGKAHAQIVITSHPPRAVKLAASQLQEYVQKITGATLKIVHEPSDDKLIKIYVGQSSYTKKLGIKVNKLRYGGYKIVSGNNWLALVGYDKDFVPTEPWARNNHDIPRATQKWDDIVHKITGSAHYWRLPLWSLYKHKIKQLDLWQYDNHGSLNAVYGYLRSLGVRWYMPGDLGKFLPATKSIEFPKVNKTVRPDIKIRWMSIPLGSKRTHPLWFLRLGNNDRTNTWAHGMHNVLAREKQRQTHPDIYRMLNSKKDNVGTYVHAYLSPPKTVKEAVTYVETVFKQYPNIKILSIMPSDGFTRIDQRDKDLATPERGKSGKFSDYVWNFVNHVAKQVYKKYPDRYISCCAYSTYRLPPLKINKLSPNVMVMIVNGRVRSRLSAEARAKMASLRRAWMKKTDNPISIYINNHSGTYKPLFLPHIIGYGIKAMVKDHVFADQEWFINAHHSTARTSFNIWIMSRLWWNADQNIDTLIKQYCSDMYGPAAGDMEKFIAYNQANYPKIGIDQKVTNQVLTLFDRARAAAPLGSDYSKRLALINSHLKTLRNRAAQLNIKEKRGKVRQFSKLINMRNNKWRQARQALVIDGKLNDSFWTGYPYGGKLWQIGKRKKAKPATIFYARWWKNNLYFGIRCDFNPKDKPVISTTKNSLDILKGDYVEIDLETAAHSYYQIDVNPAGALVSKDAAHKNPDKNWSAQAKTASYIGKDFWSVEIKIPVSNPDSNPKNSVQGLYPSYSLPWHFNIFRKSDSHNGGEPIYSSFAYIPSLSDLHNPMKFAQLWDHRTIPRKK